MFNPISCTPTSTQPGFRRFPNVDIHDQPHIKSWRCDLTALSHTTNLYFIACNDIVYIYSPTFPSQELVYERVAWLFPPVSSPNLGPGIDPVDPHSITRVRVDYLGNEEVLLVTCDDGDVIGWRVSEIWRAVEEKHLTPDSDADIGKHVRLFLHRNVGASAWGIAFHRHARLIAVSANTFEVTVFAYALSNASSSDSGYLDTPETTSEAEDQDFPSPRQRDHVIKLKGDHNIPSISFDNSDPSGRWLLSSSINGPNCLWDLSKPEQPARVLKLGCCISVQNPSVMPRVCMCLNRSYACHASWAAMFVDGHSCHEAKSLQEACGLGVSPEGPKRIAPCFWDITEREPRFSCRRSGPFPASWNTSTFDEHISLEDSDYMVISDSEDGATDDDIIDDEEGLAETGHVEQGSQELEEMSVNSGEEEWSMGVPTQHPQSDPHSSSHSDPGTPAQNQTMHATQTIVTGDSGNAIPSSPIFSVHTADTAPDNQPDGAPYTSLASHLNATVVASNMSSSSSSPLSEPESTDDEFDLEAFLQHDDGIVQQALANVNYPPPAPEPTHASSKHPFAELWTSTSFSPEENESQPHPCIFVTKEEIYLFQRPFDSTGDFVDPILFMRNPLFPPTKNNAQGGNGSDGGPIPTHHRHCFAEMINELGIFIVGTPAGRVGIFSLTTTQQENGKSLFGFRLEHLLPSKQEGDEVVIGDVWGRKLVGIAVGPVQGMLDGEGGEGCGGQRVQRPRRWRLIMHYIDHTVYTYELGKYSANVHTPGLGDLVV